MESYGREYPLQLIRDWDKSIVGQREYKEALARNLYRYGVKGEDLDEVDKLVTSQKSAVDFVADGTASADADSGWRKDARGEQYEHCNDCGHNSKE